MNILEDSVHLLTIDLASYYTDIPEHVILRYVRNGIISHKEVKGKTIINTIELRLLYAKEKLEEALEYYCYDEEAYLDDEFNESDHWGYIEEYMKSDLELVIEVLGPVVKDFGEDKY